MKTLITCHANADFDAFASILAARHLYEDCLLLFPGTQERGLQALYQGLDGAVWGFVEPEDIPWDEIGRLVLVDTAQKGRVPHVEKLLKRQDLELVVWDHHPANADDVAATERHSAQIGSACALICLELMARQLSIDAREATYLGLGIYADTGSFTYSSTTRDDFTAASWLLGMGMDVRQISDLAEHELTSLHVHVLNNLLESARKYLIGQSAVVIAETSLDQYLGDFAHLAQRLMEMEKFPVLFALGTRGSTVQVVARSRDDKIDVGRICAGLGGGGHAFAASASVRDKSAIEIRELIVQALCLEEKSEKSAAQFMSAPAIGIDEEGSLRQADELMLHFGLKSVPVFRRGTRQCLGIIEAQVASRATAHGLGNAPVQEYMKRRIFTLPPSAGIQEVAAIIVGERQRLVPIVENGETVGVISRTDLINVLAGERYAEKDLAASQSRDDDVARLLAERLPERMRQLLDLAGQVGRELRMPVYAVGGFARDLFLGRHNSDLDLVVEGNGITFADALALRLEGRVRRHKKFHTSSIIYRNEAGGEERIDVATARLEYYESPAALPTVELSSIKMDLFRRDFSINALAIRLDSLPDASLVDFFGGRRDIRDRIIRVLHTLSFVEDPTRCLRAVRFEQRYSFRIGQGTEKLMKNSLALGMMERLSSHRLFNEYHHICTEADPPACFFRMDELGIMQAILPGWHLPEGRKKLLLRCRQMLEWYRLLFYEEKADAWFLYFLALAQNLRYRECALWYDRLGLPMAQKNALLSQREHVRYLKRRLRLWHRENDGVPQPDISGLCDLLRPLGIECLIFLMATATRPEYEKTVSRYITVWRREKADVSGDDLVAMGLEPGPHFTRILRELLKAKLNGQAPGAESQLALVPAIAAALGLEQGPTQKA